VRCQACSAELPENAKFCHGEAVAVVPGHNPVPCLDGVALDDAPTDVPLDPGRQVPQADRAVPDLRRPNRAYAQAKCQHRRDTRGLRHQVHATPVCSPLPPCSGTECILPSRHP
jgi:hypothetical protein